MTEENLGIMRGSHEHRAERIILAAYLLWLAGAMISVTMWKEYGVFSAMSVYLRRAAHFLLLLEFLGRGNYTKKDAAGVFLILFIGIVSKHSVYNNFLIPAMIFVFFSSRVRFRDILRLTLIFQAAFMAVTVSASRLGVIEDLIWYEGERIRHSLGYVYCGYPAHFLLFMTLMWLCLRRRAHLADAAVLLAASCLMYRVTDSRTDFLLSVLAIAGAFVWTADCGARWFGAARVFLMKYGFFAAAAGSIAMHLFYDPENPFMLRLNYALNNRLQFGADAIRDYGFSLFGREIRWVGQGTLMADSSKIYNYVDCAFLKDGLTFGLVFLLLLAAGFYLTGKRLSEQGRYMEGWAVLVSLAYAVFNAHLCVLYFNVFILLTGEYFSLQSAPQTVRGRQGDEGCSLAFRDGPAAGRNGIFALLSGLSDRISANVGGFLSALGETVPAGCRPKARRRAARTAVFLCLFLYVIRVQCLKNAQVVRSAELHMWVAAGALLILSALCQEKENLTARAGGAASKLLLLFLILAGVSDLISERRFRDAPFMLLVFGGLFCRAWSGMQRPRDLLEEFTWACKGGFALGLAYCVFARPAQAGIRYSGMLPDAERYGAVMTVCLAVFLSGACPAGSGGDHMDSFHTGQAGFVMGERGTAVLCEVLNGVGAAAALYLVWLTQELASAAAAAAVLLVFAVFWAWRWAAGGRREKLLWLAEAAVIAAAGLAAVLLLRFLLYRLAPALGTQLVYESDSRKTIRLQLQYALSGDGWKQFFDGKWNICRKYLQDMNLAGHPDRIRYKGRKPWAASSIVMNLYRYGAAAGAVYILMVPVYLREAVKSTLRRREFLPAGMAAASAAAAMMTVTELPFANFNWLVFYFGYAWMIVESRKGK